jgi:glycosyltransferase involved in cell wall biosynthesis
VGANIDVVTPECGILVETKHEWERAFRDLYEHPERRVQMGKEARNRVVQNYSLNKNAEVLAGIIRKIEREKDAR